MSIFLRFTDGQSDKFWTVEVDGSSHTVRYGKWGATGQSKTKAFPSEEAAQKDAESQAAKKRKKGYEDAEPDSADASAKPAAKPKKSSAKPKADKPKKSPAKKAPAKKSAKKAPAKKSAKKAKPPSERTIKSFFKAIRENNRERVEKELDRGLDPNVRKSDVYPGEEPWPALYYACFQKVPEMACLLLERGADATATVGGANALFYARDAALAQRLVDAGADVRAAAKGITALHQTDDVDVARVLLDAGADVDAEDDNGRTPFEATVSVPLRDLLLERGAKGLRTHDGEVIEVQSEPSSLDAANADRGALGFGPDGALWIGGYAGLFRLHEGQVTRFVLHEYAAIGGIHAAHGMLYITSNWGVFRFDGSEWRLFTPNDSLLHEKHLTNSMVVDDALWCVGYQSETKAKHATVIADDGWTLKRPGVDLPESTLGHVWRDANGQLCVADGLMGDGGYFTGGGSEWTHNPISDGVWSPKVYAVAAHEGRDYLATHMGLFRRESADGAWTKIHDEAFGSLAFIDGALFATTGYNGLFVMRAGAKGFRQITSDQAGVDLNNLEEVVPYPGGGALLRAGSHLYRVDDELTFAELNAAQHVPPVQDDWEASPLPQTALCDVALLPDAWVERASAAEVDGLPAGALVDLADPAIAVHLSDDAPAVGASKRGGQPDLPADLEWPLHPEDEDSLPFLLQLDLAALAEVDVASRLPKAGRLYFFADTSPEGEHSVVLYSATEEVAPRETPEDLADRGGPEFIASFSEKALRFETTYTLPSHDWLIEHGMQESAEDEYDALNEALRTSESETQLLGWPDPVQGELLAGAGAVVLLQLGAMDDEFGRYIVDGLRYWIIDRGDLAAGDFTDVFSVYQFT